MELSQQFGKNIGRSEIFSRPLRLNSLGFIFV
jgi:hypothetical protein